MTKAPEEGEIWEWRAFGNLSHSLESKIKAHPFRLDVMGRPLANIVGEDLYLISPSSPHNIKLRKSFGSDWLLKFKLLLSIEARLIELYHESEKKSFRFPVSPTIVLETAQLLHTALPPGYSVNGAVSDQQFLDTFARATPPMLQVRVGKIRSQYQFPGGWVEVADAVFPRMKTQSVSLHAFRREAVVAMLDELQVEAEFAAMNYLDACQKWG